MHIDGLERGSVEDKDNHGISIVRSLCISLSKHQMLTGTSGSSMECLLVLPRLTIFEWLLVHTCGVYRCLVHNRHSTVATPVGTDNSRIVLVSH